MNYFIIDENLLGAALDAINSPDFHVPGTSKIGFYNQLMSVKNLPLNRENLQRVEDHERRQAFAMQNVSAPQKPQTPEAVKATIAEQKDKILKRAYKKSKNLKK